MSMFLLETRDLSVSYNEVPALRKVSIKAAKGEVVSVLGPNGSGKTTLLKSISGLVPSEPGSKVLLNGEEIQNLAPHKITRLGVIHVPEGRQVFAELTVQENLEVAATRIGLAKARPNIERVYELFSELKPRKGQMAGTLSGGEQQMLAIGRAIVSEPLIMMIDEPSMGLAPVIVKRIFETLKNFVKDTGLTMLIVEQNAKLSLPMSDRVYIVSQGQIKLEGSVEEVKSDEKIREMYFGGK
jgi:branched-chain amino acid transport system ATP-binding protein